VGGFSRRYKQQDMPDLQPWIFQFAPKTQGHALGWDDSASLALSFADSMEAFSAGITVRPECRAIHSITLRSDASIRCGGLLWG
jgi:hypothetical protein